jgi:hypothetical protein
MSKKAMDWADTVHIANGPMKQVLGRLAYLHREGKELFPSQAYLAEKTQLSERTVRYALQLLAYFGVVRRIARSNGARGRTSDVMVLSFGLHEITRDQVTTARRALRKPLSIRHRVPVVVVKSQPAPHAGAPGTACQGIGDLIEEPSQEVTGLSVGQYAREAAGDRTRLRLVVGGKP